MFETKIFSENGVWKCELRQGGASCSTIWLSAEGENLTTEQVLGKAEKWLDGKRKS